MSLRYIFGPASSGKTHRCLTEIVSNMPSGKNLIYIVPEQYSLQSENDLAALNGKAVMRAQVLSFNRLAHYVFSEVGFSRKNDLDECAKNMLLRKIIFDLRGELEFFRNSVNKPGFIDNLGRLFTEFCKYGVTPESLGSAARENPETLRLKAADIAAVYGKYLEYIETDYLTPDTELDHLAGLTGKSKYLTGSLVWLDGFFGFTPQEYSVIAGLMPAAGGITAALTLRECAARFDVSADDPFYATKTTVNKLSALAAECGVPLGESVLLGGERAIKQFPGAAALEKNFFRVGGARETETPDGPANIKIYSAADPFAEINRAAGRIINLVRDEGYRFRDIAVITGGASGYGALLPGVFEEYGIPVFTDIKRDILSHRLVELIRAAVAVAAANWSYESVFRFLKSGMTAAPEDDIFELENYCVAYGIKGYKWKLAEWKPGGDAFDLTRINEIKRRVVNMLAPFADGVRPDTVMSVLEYSRRIYAMLDGVGAAGTLEKLADTAAAAGDRLEARKFSQVWKTVRGVFEKLVAMLGGEIIGVKEFARILDAGLSCADMGMLPPTKDQVIAGDIERSRLPVMRALFLLNVNEGILPAVNREGGILSEPDRARLMGSGLTLADSASDRLKQELSVYSLTAKPSEYLEISYARTSANGKAANPSGLIARIRRIFPEIKTDDGDEFVISAPSPVFGETGRMLRDIGRDGPEAVLYRDVYNYFNDSDAYRERLRRMAELADGGERGERLSPETLEKLYGDEIVTSVSRLEKYAACPFAYFMRYNLDARERKVYEVASVDLGSLLHEILEEITGLMLSKGMRFKDLDEELIGGMTAEAFENIKIRPEREIFFSNASNLHMTGRVLRVVKRSVWALAEHMRLGDFTELGSEITIRSGEPIARIELGGGGGKSFTLTGRVDRVDVLDFNGRAYIKIIDYKSGAKKFDIDDVYAGTQMQLALYLDYFMNDLKLYPDALPGGIYYFNLADPVINSEGFDFNSEDPYAGLNEKILSEFRMSGLTLADGDIVKKLDRNIKTSSLVLQNVGFGAGSANGFKKSSAVADEREFLELLNGVREKAEEMGRGMVSGYIAPRPYKKGPETACRYCEYGGVCGFEAREI